MATFQKAVVAAVLAGLSAGTAAWPGGITGQEWGVILGSVIAAGWAVYRVPNKTKGDEEPHEEL
jgi:hypothetical protein